MAKVRLEKCAGLPEVDLCREDFTLWNWAEPEAPFSDEATAVSGLKYEEFQNFLYGLQQNLMKTNSGKNSTTAGGLFRIRWNPQDACDFSSRTGTINVAYGYNASISRHLNVTSYIRDTLYIGKARDVRERVTRMFSSQQSSNSVARKLEALLNDRTQENKLQDTKKIKASIVFDFVLETHPVKRDFMKAYAVSIEKPCLNIVMEH